MSRRKQNRPQQITMKPVGCDDVDLLSLSNHNNLPKDLLQLKRTKDDPLTTGIFTVIALPKGSRFGPFNCDTLIKRQLQCLKLGQSQDQDLQFYGSGDLDDFITVRIHSEAGVWLSLLTTTGNISLSNLHIYLHDSSLWCEASTDIPANTQLIAMLLIQSCDLRANLPYNNYNKGTDGRFLRLPHYTLHNKGVDLLHVPAAFQLVPHRNVDDTTIPSPCINKSMDVGEEKLQTLYNSTGKRKHDEEDITSHKKILKKPTQEASPSNSPRREHASPSNSPRREHSPPITGAFKCATCTYTADKKSWLIEHMLYEHIENEMDVKNDDRKDDKQIVDDNVTEQQLNIMEDHSLPNGPDHKNSSPNKPDCNVSSSDGTDNTQYKRPDQVKIEVNAEDDEQTGDNLRTNASPSHSLEIVPKETKMERSPQQSPTCSSPQQYLHPRSPQGSPKSRSASQSPKTRCSLNSPEMSPKSAQLEYACDQCDITFSSESTYQAHKQFYCGLRSKRVKTEAGFTLLPAMVTPALLPTPMMTPFGMTYALPYIVPVTSPLVSPQSPNKEKTKKKKLEEEPLDLSCRKPTRAVLNHVIRPAVSRCDQCNIVFYKHENYMVHKQHYCAGRRKTPVSPQHRSPDKYTSPSVSPVCSSPGTPTNGESDKNTSEEYTVQYFCLPCKIQFSSPDTLEAHQQYYCPARNMMGSNEPTECPHCDLDFLSVEDLSKHLCTHTTMKIPMYCCPYCQYVAQSDSRLLDHIKSHAPTKAYRCTLCGYRGNTVRGMRMHGKSHLDAGEKFTDENMVEYEEPPLIPKRLRTITESVSIATEPLHITNERKRLRSKSSSSSEEFIASRRQAPHICVECNSIFIDTNKLRLHMQLHLQDKYFKCSLCDFTAEIKDDLLRHVKAIHQKKDVKKEVKNSSKYTIENLINICPQDEDSINRSPPAKVIQSDQWRSPTNDQRRSLTTDQRHSPYTVHRSSPNTSQRHSPNKDHRRSPNNDRCHSPNNDKRYNPNNGQRSPPIQCDLEDSTYSTKIEPSEQKFSQVREMDDTATDDSNNQPIGQQNDTLIINQSRSSSTPVMALISPSLMTSKESRSSSPGPAPLSAIDPDISNQLDSRTEQLTKSNSQIGIDQPTNYCSQCDIKFVYMSTFLAHKKYYCSSHAGEKRQNTVPPV